MILKPVDKFLRMLKTDTDSYSFRLKLYSLIFQKMIYIASRMPCGEYYWT